MINNKNPRGVCEHDRRFPGPLLELDPDCGYWRFPDPPVVTALDHWRIVATWFNGLDPIDSALLFRIIELNSEAV